MVPAGHEMAREQLGAKTNDFFKGLTPAAGRLQVTLTDKAIDFTSGNTTGSFNIKQAKFTRYEVNHIPVAVQLPEPYFWRAPTDNDFGNQMPNKLGFWRSAHHLLKVDTVMVHPQNAAGVQIECRHTMTAVNVPYKLVYELRNDGSIKVTADIDFGNSKLPEMPRFGMRMFLPREYASIEFYGRGPWENYSDRKTASFLGWYQQTADEQFVANYIRPQENGYRTDVRWVQFSGADNHGVKIIGLQPICFSALPYMAEDLDPGNSKKQQHPSDLNERKFLSVHIDLNQRGVGGDNSWGALPHAEYLLTEKKYSYSYIIEPF
jgi:beta-galactosidase